MCRLSQRNGTAAYNMSEYGKKVSLVTVEGIAAVVAFWGFWWFIDVPLCSISRGSFSSLFLWGVLAFSAIWIVIVKFLPLKSVHLKVILTLLVLAFCAAEAATYTVDYILRDFKW